MRNSKMYEPSMVFEPQGAHKDYSVVELACGLGKHTVGLALQELEQAEMGNNQVIFGNDDFTITITARNSGAIGRVFYDLFENDEE